MTGNVNRRRWPTRAWVGPLLVALCWPLSWLLPGLRTHLLFFPLWLGYILTVDAVVATRTGTSILTRSVGGFVLLFVASAPAWWLFELLNLRLGNWEYLARANFTDLEYFLLASLSFSTVIPAVFETAELVKSFAWSERYNGRRAVLPSRRLCLGLFAAGALLLAALLLWPRYFFPFTWISLVLILEPVCAWLGKPALLRHVARGNWRPLVALALGALICGFFWELWNYWSYPKWIYHIPFVQFAHVFEMPLLGYGGYLPFGLELYPIAHLLLPKQLLRLTLPGPAS